MRRLLFWVGLNSGPRWQLPPPVPIRAKGGHEGYTIPHTPRLWHTSTQLHLPVNQSRSKLEEMGGVPAFGEQGVVCDLLYAVRLASQAWESGFVVPGPACFQVSVVG